MKNVSVIFIKESVFKVIVYNFTTFMFREDELRVKRISQPHRPHSRQVTVPDLTVL